MSECRVALAPCAGAWRSTCTAGHSDYTVRMFAIAAYVPNTDTGALLLVAWYEKKLAILRILGAALTSATLLDS